MVYLGATYALEEEPHPLWRGTAQTHWFLPPLFNGRKLIRGGVKTYGIPLILVVFQRKEEVYFPVVTHYRFSGAKRR